MDEQNRLPEILSVVPEESMETPTRTIRRFRCGQDLFPLMDKWAKRGGYLTVGENEERARYKKNHAWSTTYLEVMKNEQGYRLAAWTEFSFLLRALSLFFLPERKSLKPQSFVGALQRKGAHDVNVLLRKLELPEIHSHTPGWEWTLPILATCVSFLGLLLYAGTTSRIGFRNGLYIPARGLKFGVITALLFPAITAIFFHYWFTVRNRRGLLVRGLSVVLAIVYFAGAFSYGVERSGLMSLILLNETGYYCVEKKIPDECSQAKSALSSRPKKEKKMIVQYADTLLSNYRTSHAEPVQ